MNLFGVLTYFMFLALIAGLVYITYDGLRIFKSIPYKLVKWAWCIHLFCFLAIYVMWYPGLIIVDHLRLLQQVQTGAPSDWSSLTYSLYCAADQLLFKGIGLAVFYPILFYNYLVLLIFAYIAKQGVHIKIKLAAVMLLILLSLSPINQGLLFTASRDIPFSLLVIWLGFNFLYKKIWSFGQLLIFLIVLVFVADLRQDAKIYLITVPVLFFIFKAWNFRQLTFALSIVSVIGYLYLYLIPQSLGINAYKKRYVVTAWVLPISYIVKEIKIESIDPQIKLKIEKVLNLEKLVEYQSPIEIIPLWHGAFQGRNVSEREWKDFQFAAAELILSHKKLFLQSRVVLFQSILRIGEPFFLFANDMYSTQSNILQMRELVGSGPEQYSESKLGHSYFDQIIKLASSPPGYYLWIENLVLPLLFSIGILFCYQFFPALSLMSLIVLMRLPIVFLLAPSGQARYMYALILFFIFCLPMFLIRICEKYGFKFRSKNQ